MTATLERYQRIGLLYDPLDLPFAKFDRHTSTHVTEAGLERLHARHVVPELMQLLTFRVPE